MYSRNTAGAGLLEECKPSARLKASNKNARPGLTRGSLVKAYALEVFGLFFRLFLRLFFFHGLGWLLLGVFFCVRAFTHRILLEKLIIHRVPGYRGAPFRLSGSILVHRLITPNCPVKGEASDYKRGIPYSTDQPEPFSTSFDQELVRLRSVISGGTLSRIGVKVVPIPRLTYNCESPILYNPSGYSVTRWAMLISPPGSRSLTCPPW